jgi:peroxidase
LIYHKLKYIQPGIVKTQLCITFTAMLFTLAPMSLSADQISPARGIEHKPNRGVRPKHLAHPRPKQSYRSFDGSLNHQSDPTIGAVNIQLIRLAPSDYSDGISSLAGANRPSARAVSNVVLEQTYPVLNDLGATDFMWQWGQFLDHDIDLTDGTDPTESADIEIPDNDEYFTTAIAFNRSIYDLQSNPRQQLNEISAWIDASNVYGSSLERANALRTLSGDGKLKTSAGNLLPFNELGFPNAGGNGSSLFIAGDVRANEHVGLTALHTLFMREHNRLANIIAQKHPKLSGEKIYQKARQLVLNPTTFYFLGQFLTLHFGLFPRP